MYPRFDTFVEENLAIERQVPSLRIVDKFLQFQIGDSVTVLMRKRDDVAGYSFGSCNGDGTSP